MARRLNSMAQTGGSSYCFRALRIFHLTFHLPAQMAIGTPAVSCFPILILDTWGPLKIQPKFILSLLNQGQRVFFKGQHPLYLFPGCFMSCETCETVFLNLTQLPKHDQLCWFWLSYIKFLLSWKWLNICILIGSSESIPYLFLFVHAAFA